MEVLVARLRVVFGFINKVNTMDVAKHVWHFAQQGNTTGGLPISLSVVDFRSI